MLSWWKFQGTDEIVIYQKMVQSLAAGLLICIYFLVGMAPILSKCIPLILLAPAKWRRMTNWWNMMPCCWIGSLIHIILDLRGMIHRKRWLGEFSLWYFSSCLFSLVYWLTCFREIFVDPVNTNFSWKCYIFCVYALVIVC